MLPFIGFGKLNTRKAMKRLDWPQFPRKINSQLYMPYTIYP
jgi:hypothetical protein